MREDYCDDGDAWASFPHDHARSRAYRWNEDGMAGISDIRHELCLALALWNGDDPILKERMFGLTGPQGNHGEDVKEYWWYLEGLPSHALLRWRYHYPQAAFPYERPRRPRTAARLRRPRARAARHRRLRRRPLLGRSTSPTRRPRRPRSCARIDIENHGPGRGDPPRAADALVPQHLALERLRRTPPRCELDGDAVTVAPTTRSPGYRLEAAPGPDGGAPDGAVLRQRDERSRASSASEPITAVSEGRHQRPRRRRRGHGEPGRRPARRLPGGTACTVPGGGKRRAAAPAAPARARRREAGAASRRPAVGRQRAFDEMVARARGATPTSSTPRSPPAGTTPERDADPAPGVRRARLEQADVPVQRGRWLDGDPAEPAPPPGHRHGRNSGWRHLDAFDVLAMPDPWEYPWFAAWDLAFHAVAWAHLDPAFAKYQLLVLLREWFQHPNGALPAYEWNFDDVNPPVHVMAALRVFLIDGGTDREFLERVFQKLLLNFTWWLNRQDADGNNVFGGGFLGLDNISPIDRSNLPPGVALEQADGTAWMAYYALAMLVDRPPARRGRTPVYEDMVVKFVEQFLMIVGALEEAGPLRPRGRLLLRPARGPGGRHADPGADARRAPSRLLPAAVLRTADATTARRLRQAVRPPRRQGPRSSRGAVPARPLQRGRRPGHALRRRARGAAARAGVPLRRGGVPLAARAPLGLEAPRRCRTRSRGDPEATIDYEPGEGRTAMYGGNSNWRGPVWMPLNYLVIPALVRYHRFLGDEFTVEYPTGSGEQRTLADIAQDLADRLISIWLPGPDGRRPVFGDTELLQDDPAWKDLLWFPEYFHGDNGAGLGAMHQTGWTAEVINLLLDPPRDSVVG